MIRFSYLLTLCLLSSNLSFGQTTETKIQPGRVVFTSPGKVKFEDLRRPFILKISPFHFFDRTLNVGGEIFMDKTYKKSMYVAVNGTYQDNSRRMDKGVSADLQFRYYPRFFKADSAGWIRNSASGFFVGIGATIGTNKLEELDYYDYTNNQQYKYSINSQWVTPAIVFGYQFIAWEALYFDVYLGGGIKINDVSYKTENNNPNFSTDVISEANIFSRYYKGILPKAGFTLGVGL